MTVFRNGGITERRKINRNPKRRNEGMAENLPLMLKNGMTERRKFTVTPQTKRDGTINPVLG